jgi:hypothetical protein
MPSADIGHPPHLTHTSIAVSSSPPTIEELFLRHCGQAPS